MSIIRRKNFNSPLAVLSLNWHASTKPHAERRTAGCVCDAIQADVKRIPRSQHVVHRSRFAVVTIYLRYESKLLIRLQPAFSKETSICLLCDISEKLVDMVL